MSGGASYFANNSTANILGMNMSLGCLSPAAIGNLMRFEDYSRNSDRTDPNKPNSPLKKDDSTKKPAPKKPTKKAPKRRKRR